MQGKEKRSAYCSCSFQDHPRTCGEKLPLCGILSVQRGSPPHMRGKVTRLYALADKDGITPAHAGKSCAVRAHIPAQWDHPRTCGEKQSALSCICSQKGSPPHMRGKECSGWHQCLPVGITPAHAGKRLKRSRSIVPHAAIVPLFPSVCNKPAGSDGSPAGHDAPPFLPIENAVPASPAYNLRSL